MNKLLKKLLGLLFPGIDGDADDLPDDPDALDPADDAVDDLPDDDLPDDPPARQVAARRDDAADRLARLEAEVERRGRAAEERERASRTPTVDAEFQREEERLHAADVSEMERWQIQANRTLRATQAEARQAMFQAQDMSDRARFEAKISTEPRRAKYTERVEEEVKKAQSRGQMASREDVYYWMLGKDIADGKLKPKTKSAPAVARGKPAGVRSDVQGRGRPSSDRDKLRSRLDNVNI